MCTSFLIIVQSHPSELLWKAMSNGTPFTAEKIFASSGPRARGYHVSMPALNLLSNRGSSKPGED